MSTVLQIIASVLGIFVTWWIGKQVTKWLQAYRTARQQSEVEDARKQSQSDNQKANEESDRLKKIDGR